MDNKVTQRQLSDLLSKTVPNHLPVLVASSPGIGKSSIFKQAAERIGFKFKAMHPATLDPVDFSGMPAPVTRGEVTRIMRLLDDYLGEVFEAKEPTLLLLDELGQAAPAVQAACAPLLLDRRVGNYTLPDFVTVCAATNSRQHRAGANNILTHLISRMATVLELVCDPRDWEDWAVRAGIRHEVISFIRFRSKLLNDFDAEKSYSEMQAYPNPRSWEHMSKLLNAGIDRSVEMAAYAGCVGPGASQEFYTHLTAVRELPDLDHMIAHPKQFKMPAGTTMASIRYAIATGVAMRISEPNHENVLEIITKIHEQKHAEFAAVALRDVLRVMPAVCGYPAFAQFQEKSPVAKTIMRV